MPPNPQKLRTPLEIGTVIRARRKALGITQKSLALQTGISVPTIIAVERGNEKTGIGVVKKKKKKLKKKKKKKIEKKR